MEYLIICSVAFLMSGLSLFSGFGLGTILLPVFALFFPLYLAITLTAIVHLFNNLLKLVLLGKHADKVVVLHFGMPAVLAAALGVQALSWLSGLPPLGSYQLGRHIFQVMPIKFIVALLMVVFALFELVPGFSKISFEKKYLPLGGILSGFLGGLSGHQGALRSAFLIKSGLSKESFIASGVVIACLVDITRIFFYNLHSLILTDSAQLGLLAAVIFSASLGVLAGNRWAKKMTMRFVQVIVAVMLLTIAVLLGAGMI